MTLGFLVALAIAAGQPIDDLRSRISGDSVAVQVRGRAVGEDPAARESSEDGASGVRYVNGCTLLEERLQDVLDCLGTPCPDGTVRGTQIDLSQTPAGSPGRSLLDRVEDGCFGGDAGGPGLELLVVQEFLEEVTPSLAFVQPATGRALVNLPLAAHAEPSPSTWTTTLLGTPVTIRATPFAYEWDFGDAAPPVVTDRPGAPWPDHAAEHTYTRTGDVAVTLTTRYTGQYSLDGGATWIPIPGTAAATSPPLPLRLVEARAQLIG